MNIVILDDYQDAIRKLDCIQEASQSFNIKIHTSNARGISQLTGRLKDADILILNYARTIITHQLLEKLPKLRLIIQIGELDQHLDVEACNKLRIGVIEGKEDITSIAEFTWSLIMTSMRRITHYTSILKHGGWQQSGLKQASLPANFSLGCRLKGKTLGIWGLGRIGETVASYGKSFGMNIIVWGGEKSSQKALTLGYTVAPSLKEFLQTSDVISMHLRLNDKNKHIVGLKEFSFMKPTALFVNTANSALIDTQALVTALNRGKPGLAAIDVYDSEPIMQGHALLRLENAICTPHIANVDKESLEEHYTQALQYIAAYQKGDEIPAINPKILLYK